MADINKLAPKIWKWEGGFVNDPADPGGATNMGVTLSTWKQVGYDKDGDNDIDIADLRQLTRTDALIVLKRFYWDRWRADLINSQPIADILVDWVWCSGKYGIVIPQKILNVKPDGIVGMITIGAINQANPQQLHKFIYSARQLFIYDIVNRNPALLKFKQGWLNRLKDFRYE